MLLKNRAALYMRLSKDDETGGESASITAQRNMLRGYAQEHGYSICGEYADDGYSGTNFDRPAFRRMIDDIESGMIDVVLTKDLSRLGRDHILAGQYTEIYFPEKGVRCIAVNDGYDSESPFTEIAPFKNVINEMYARDISRKIRSAFLARMKEGDYVAAFAPYGYQKDPLNRRRLVPDADSSQIVRRIFRQAADGVSPCEIADRLNADGVFSPARYRRRMRGETDCGGAWSASAVLKMLKNPVYLGHTAQGKSAKVSFKSGQIRRKPPSEWILVLNTHSALVDQSLFDETQRRISARRSPQKSGFRNLFAGLVYCADCHRAMSSAGTRRRDSPANLVCGTYKLRGRCVCTNHFIDYNALYQIVCQALREEFSLLNERRQEEILAAARVASPRCDVPAPIQTAVEIAKRQQRVAGIIGRLYEDHAAGLLGELQMRTLLQKYQAESRLLAERSAACHDSSQPTANTPPRREIPNALLSELLSVNELTPELLYHFIDRIEISQGNYQKNGAKQCKKQTVSIRYRFCINPKTLEMRL